MLPGCFYVLLVLGFAMNLTFTNTNLLTEPLAVPLTSFLTLRLKNLQLKTLDLPPTSLNFTSDALSLQLNGQGRVTASVEAQVVAFLGYSRADLDATISGGIEVTKNLPDQCASDSVTIGACDMKATFRILGYNVDINICDNIAEVLTAALNPAEPPLEALPSLAKGAASVKTGSYFKSLIARVALGNLLGARGRATWASETAVHLKYGLLFPISATVDTRRWSATAGARLLGSLAVSLWDDVKSTFNLPDLDNFVSGAITDGTGNNVTVDFGSADGFFADLVNNNATFYLSTYVPRDASLDFDLVAQDHKCKLFGLACSIPADKGLQVMNTRFTGLGDADGIFSNLLSNTTEDLLNRIVTDVLTVRSVRLGDRRVLSVI